MAATLLAPTTGAAASSAKWIGPDKRASLEIFAAAGLTANQYADVQYSVDEGVSWADLYQNGDQVRLHSLNNVATVYGPLLVRIDKEASTNAVGVYIEGVS